MDFLGLCRRLMGKEKGKRRGEDVDARGGGVLETGAGDAERSTIGKGRGDLGLNMLKSPPVAGRTFGVGCCS